MNLHSVFLFIKQNNPFHSPLPLFFVSFAWFLILILSLAPVVFFSVLAWLVILLLLLPLPIPISSLLFAFCTISLSYRLVCLFPQSIYLENTNLRLLIVQLLFYIKLAITTMQSNAIQNISFCCCFFSVSHFCFLCSSELLFFLHYCVSVSALVVELNLYIHTCIVSCNCPLSSSRIGCLLVSSFLYSLVLTSWSMWVIINFIGNAPRPQAGYSKSLKGCRIA